MEAAMSLSRLPMNQPHSKGKDGDSSSVDPLKPNREHSTVEQS